MFEIIAKDPDDNEEKILASYSTKKEAENVLDLINNYVNVRYFPESIFENAYDTIDEYSVKIRMLEPFKDFQHDLLKEESIKNLNEVKESLIKEILSIDNKIQTSINENIKLYECQLSENILKIISGYRYYEFYIREPKTLIIEDALSKFTDEEISEYIKNRISKGL